MSVTMQSGSAASGHVGSGRVERPGPDRIELGACVRAVREELARPSCSADSVAARLMQLGFPPLEPAWEFLWSAQAGGETAAQFARAQVAWLDVLERVALASPAAGVRRAFATRIVAQPSAAELLWIADYLTRNGSWREIDLALGLTRVDAHWLRIDPQELHESIRSALVSMLERDPLSFGSLRSLAQSSPADFGPVAVDALSMLGDGRALATLSDLLDGRKLDTAALVGALEAVGRRCLPPFDEFLLQRLRELAADEDVGVRSAALRAAGALADQESLPLQIEGMAHGDGGVRSAAGAALNELTGLRFGSDALRWQSWYAGEVEWWDGDAEAVLERLSHDDSAVVVAALAETVPHRLHRERSARAVAALLEDESPELRRLACLTIEQLGGRCVAPAVVERLADVDEGVRESAQRCLRMLFGLDLPPEAEAWRSHFERSDLVLR